MLIFKNYKKLTLNEHKELLLVRNEKKVRENSNNREVISIENHIEWVEKLPDNKMYFAIFSDDKIIGGVNYISDNNEVLKWGVFFSEKSPPLLSLIATYLFIDFMFENNEVLHSEVLVHNKKALSFNKYFGLKIISKNNVSYKLKIEKSEWDNHKRTLTSIQRRLKSVSYKFE